MEKWEKRDKKRKTPKFKKSKDYTYLHFENISNRQKKRLKKWK